MLDEKNPRTSRCIRCDTYDGHPCLVHAKADTQLVCVDPAVKQPNVSLITNAYVERLETSPSGREVTKVVVKHNGAREEYAANIVVVSCGGRQLLRSAPALGERQPSAGAGQQL